MSKGLSKEFLAERDLRIFKMRQAGVSSQEIGRRFNISTQSVSSAIKRQLEKMNREALMAYPEVLRMELERLDALQQAIWPLTQHRKVRLDDGTEMSVEPDIKAVQQVLGIMDRRAKLLGMEQQTINLNVETVDNTPRAILAGASNQGPAAVNAFSAETEARQLLELMGLSGVLPPDTVKELLGQNQKQIPSLIEIEQSTADVAEDEDGETVYE
jgi:predicted DNA-binding protein YlxM (UPF0122 family)